MGMSYVVEVDFKPYPNWYINAYQDSLVNDGVPRGVSSSWNLRYPDYVHLMNIERITVTFPDEKTYTWFVLKWS